MTMFVLCISFFILTENFEIFDTLEIQNNNKFSYWIIEKLSRSVFIVLPNRPILPKVAWRRLALLPPSWISAKDKGKI